MSALVAEDAVLFEDFRLDRRGAGLCQRDERGDFVPVPLGSRALDVLCALVASAGELVSRDQIIAAVWPATVVEDNNLNMQIAALRRVLDQGRTQSCIQTIPGRGYRFVAAVTLCASVPEIRAPTLQIGNGSLAGAYTVPTGSEVSRHPVRGGAPLLVSPRGRPRAYRGVIAGIAVMFMLVAALAIVGRHSSWFGSGTPAPRLSIAVLPFADLSPGHDQQYFADAITEDLTTDLSRLPDTFVISAYTAFSYRGRLVDARQVGRELGVRYIIEGSVQRIGNRVRVNAQLIDAALGEHLWAERFGYEIKDFFDIQSEIARRIAIALNVRLLTKEASRRTVNPDALDLILRGRAVMNKPRSRSTYAEAISFFEDALALDPAFDRWPELPCR